MKMKSTIAMALVSVFLLIGIAGIAVAGVDPEPFKNQLGAVENIISSAYGRVVKSMSNPPSNEPGPNLNGAVNRLEAISKQLTSADDMERPIAEEVMGIDPNPFHPDIVSALENVSGATQDIVQHIQDNPLGDEVPEQFVLTVEDVELSAQDIVDTVDYYLAQQSECSETCALFDEATCGVSLLCAWVPGTPGYCCDSYNPDGE